MKPSCAILAELPADGEAPEDILLLAPGVNPLAATDFREPFVLKNAAAVVAASPAEVLIDYDHRSATGGSSEAAGWASLEDREGALYGRVNWTDAGREALAARRYRYLSPEIMYRKTDREVLSVQAIALVNRPALRLQAERALASEDSGELVAALAARLGLAPDAGAAEIAAAKAALKAAGLNDRSVSSVDAVDRAMAAGHVTPAQRRAALALAAPDPAAFASFTGGDGRFAYLFHRNAPGGRFEKGPRDAAKEVARAFGRPVEAIQKARKQMEGARQ